MRIVCISDTHELHRELDVPPGDLLIHAGDFLFLAKCPSMLRNFNRWLGELPHRHKVVVPGNHDFLLEETKNRNEITNAALLIDEGVEIEGLRIWGSPVTPLYGGAFGKSNPGDRERHWAQVPSGIDILITHGARFGILDGAPNCPPNLREGCPQLRQALARIRPRLHVFGHTHAGYGVSQTPNTVFVNAALMGNAGALENRPIVVNLSLAAAKR